MTEIETIIKHIEENNNRIENIKFFMSSNPDANIDDCKRNIEILTISNKALEKQIAKKPILKHDVSVMHINRGNQPHEWKMLESDNWHCSECDSFVGERVYVLDMHHDQRKKKYCDNCGQKLDWSDSD